MENTNKIYFKVLLSGRRLYKVLGILNASDCKYVITKHPNKLSYWVQARIDRNVYKLVEAYFPVCMYVR